MYPKVVALDTDWTIFSGRLNANTWGKGPNAHKLVEDNIKKTDDWEIRDRTNEKNKCRMYADIPNIISDILKNGAQLAIVSRNTSKDMCDRALWYWHVKDAQGNQKRLIDLVKYDEVYDKSKTVHFSKIKGWAGCHYTDMILFDDSATNNNVEMLLDKKGLTWDNYQQGINMWRRNKAIESPWHGMKLKSYPKKKFLGYSGMDIETIKLLEAGGRRHDRKEAARWGFAMYVADDPAIAKYFGEWIKRTTAGFDESIVCSVWARDGDIWDGMNKIWVPDRQDLKTDVKDEESDIAWSQENRDRQVASWGVQKPYVLFARHPNMREHKGLHFPVPNNRRWNEMVIYPQIQEALIVIERMTDPELTKAAADRKRHMHYEDKLHSWNIIVPKETQKDFQAHGENIRK